MFDHIINLSSWITLRLKFTKTGAFEDFFNNLVEG